MKGKTFIKIILVLGMVFGIFFGLGAGLQATVLNRLVAQPKATVASSQIATGERTNILFLGLDARPGETNSRSDTMIMASIDPQLKKIALISIPRDTRVSLLGKEDKINAANYYSGPQLAMTEVSDLIGEPVDYYVKMDFNGFTKIIDTLGGVDINVDKRMYKPSEKIDLYPGHQHLNGYNALAYVRFRGYVLGDIERTNHQQTFIKALAAKVLQPLTIVKLPLLIKETNQYVDTNLQLGDMLKMVTWAPGFSKNPIVSQTLPGSFYNETSSNGTLLCSYWEVDQTQASGILDKLFAGQTVATMVATPDASQSSAGSQYETNSSDGESTNKI
jgi:LCP family protein required for cell wall assembly